MTDLNDNWRHKVVEQPSPEVLDGADCCASSDLDAVKSWGPLVIADVVGGDIAQNTVTLRIHGPMPHTILGAQWFLFHDAPPAAERLPFPFLHNSQAQPPSVG